MYIDGVYELPGTICKICTRIGWGLSLLGGIIEGYEKYSSGASLISSIAGDTINTGINVACMYAASGIASLAMSSMAAMCLPGGIVILGGVSFSFGTVTGNVTNETTVSIGWGTLAFAYAACGAIAATPVPFARAVAAVTACVVVLIDIFN